MRGRSERHASAASSPIEPIAHLPCAAIGASRTRRSSLRVAEHLLAARSAARDSRCSLGPRRAADRRAARGCARPTSRYGMPARRSAALISSSSTMRPCSRSTKKIRPGCSRPFAHDVLGRDLEHADLGRHHDEAVLRDDVARGAQAVAVEHRADLAAVGERDRRGAVPGLHQERVVLVVGAPIGIHLGVVLPRLGDHHQDGFGQLAAGQHQELERVVELRRVADARSRQDRIELLQIVAEQRRAQRALARVHPVAVAAQRVDLAVVREVAEGMGEIPGRERVGAVARVHERERRLQRRVGEIADRSRSICVRDQHARCRRACGSSRLGT